MSYARVIPNHDPITTMATTATVYLPACTGRNCGCTFAVTPNVDCDRVWGLITTDLICCIGRTQPLDGVISRWRVCTRRFFAIMLRCCCDHSSFLHESQRLTGQKWRNSICLWRYVCDQEWTSNATRHCCSVHYEWSERVNCVKQEEASAKVIGTWEVGWPKRRDISIVSTITSCQTPVRRAL
jgi:hypothetical protein